MKNFNSKYIILFITFILLFGTFQGCSSKEGKLENKQPVFVKNQKEATLVFCFPGSSHPDFPAVAAEVEKRTRNQLNIKLGFKWIPWGQYLQNVKTMVNSGEQIDAFVTGREGSSDILAQMESEKLLLDITSLFQQYAPQHYVRYAKEELEAVTLNGKLLGIPLHYPVSYRVCALVRDDLMKKYNISDIKDFDEYETYLRALKENEKGIIPGQCLYDTCSTFAESYGYVTLDPYLVYKWEDKGIKLVPWEQTNEFKSSVETFKRWNDKGYINNNLPGKDSLINGKLGSVIETFMAAVSDMSTMYGEAYSFRICPLYIDSLTKKVNDTVAISFSKNTQNAERALEFINWIQSSQENYDLFMYGIKDKNYSLHNDGRITFSDADSKYFGWSGSTPFYNIDYVRPTISDKPDFKKKYNEITTVNAKYPPTAGFYPDMSKIQGIVEQRKASYMDFNEKIRNGIIDMQMIDDFIKGQKDANINLVINELQKQISNWKK